MSCFHSAAECTNGQVQDAKQQAAKKKKGHGKGRDQAFSALVDYFQNTNGDGEDDSDS